MFTPASPVSANSRASAPGSSGIATRHLGQRRCSAHRACRGSPRSPRRRPPAPPRPAPGRRRPSDATSSSIPSRTDSNRSASGAGVGVTICRHSAGSPAAIRVTSRTPCPLSARCSGGASPSWPAVKRREQMRQVRDPRHRQVVLLGGHAGRRPRRTSRPAPRPPRPPSGRRPRRAHHRPGPALEQVRRRRHRPRALTAGHRVPADVAARVDAAPRCSSASGRPFTLPTSVTTASGYAASALRSRHRAGRAAWPRRPARRRPAPGRPSQRRATPRRARPSGSTSRTYVFDAGPPERHRRPRRRSARPRRRAPGPSGGCGLVMPEAYIVQP